MRRMTDERLHYLDEKSDALSAAEDIELWLEIERCRAREAKLDAALRQADDVLLEAFNTATPPLRDDIHAVRIPIVAALETE